MLWCLAMPTLIAAKKWGLPCCECVGLGGGGGRRAREPCPVVGVAVRHQFQPYLDAPHEGGADLQRKQHVSQNLLP